MIEVDILGLLYVKCKALVKIVRWSRFDGWSQQIHRLFQRLLKKSSF